jgi:L-threonylcarbamoyladenylate synthase
VPSPSSYGETGSIFAPTRETLAKAAEIIKNGGLVAFPTETVYGLGANALDVSAVRKIFDAKGRPQDNPLILHVANIREASLYADMNPSAELLMQHFWPGPLTIVLYASDTVPLVTRGNLETVALRVPMNYIALELIHETGLPIAAPSANRSGRPSPTTAETVRNDLGSAVDMIIDGGESSIGVESTVIDATGEKIAILRPGGVTREMLEHIVDVEAENPANPARSPGTRHKHYAPSIGVRLWKDDSLDIFSEAAGSWCYLGMRQPPEGAVAQIIFHSPGEYAHELFHALRKLERCGAKLIIADLPEGKGLGAAIRNRLIRAAGN